MINRKCKTSSVRHKDGSMAKKSINKNSGIVKQMRYNIWKYGSGYFQSANFKEKWNHPATFPDDLAKDHIMSWSNEGDIVLDPMCGSGTVCRMAKKLNRKYIGIDVSSEYCKLAKSGIADVKIIKDGLKKWL